MITINKSIWQCYRYGWIAVIPNTDLCQEAYHRFPNLWLIHAADYTPHFYPEYRLVLFPMKYGPDLYSKNLLMNSGWKIKEYFDTIQDKLFIPRIEVACVKNSLETIFPNHRFVSAGQRGLEVSWLVDYNQERKV